ncbi:hypothetical protein ACNJUT_21680, partial [Mycobacterium tuberculosis]
MTVEPSPSRRRLLALVGGAGTAMGLSGCGLASLPSVPPPAAFYGGPRPTQDFAPIPYSDWGADEPGYRLYPGDVLDFAVPSASELARR